jgi:hypothetical protein
VDSFVCDLLPAMGRVWYIAPFSLVGDTQACFFLPLSVSGHCVVRGSEREPLATVQPPDNLIIGRLVTGITGVGAHRRANCSVAKIAQARESSGSTPSGGWMHGPESEGLQQKNRYWDLSKTFKSPRFGLRPVSLCRGPVFLLLDVPIASRSSNLLSILRYLSRPYSHLSCVGAGSKASHGKGHCHCEGSEAMEGDHFEFGKLPDLPGKAYAAARLTLGFWSQELAPRAQDSLSSWPNAPRCEASRCLGRCGGQVWCR